MGQLVSVFDIGAFDEEEVRSPNARAVREQLRKELVSGGSDKEG